MKGMLTRSIQEKNNTGYVGDRNVDAELEEMLKSLKTSIKLFGCGGGGCNTITRVMEKGLAGAEAFAAA